MEGYRFILDGLCLSLCVWFVGCHPDLRELISKRGRNKEGKIRLVGGRTEYQGRLEVFHDGRWGTVCDDNFDRFSARVVCRQLGHSGGKVTEFASGMYGPGEGPTWMDNVSCEGGETRLVDCNFPGWEIEDCSHFEDVGIKCDRVEEGKLRLTGGATPLQGRLEIVHDERWGSVCDDGWTQVNSRVVCSQLGYSGGTVYEASDGSGTGPIWMDDVACRGDEDSLMDCNFPGWKLEDCSHFEDLMIACDPLEEGTVRLVSGQNEQEGRVEIVHNGKWGTICDDDFDENDAQVVCRQLGYSGGSVAREAAFGRGKGPIWMDQVTCSGNEQRLTECEYPGWRQEDCSHWEDVGVVCIPVLTVPEEEEDRNEVESNNSPI
ncbi:neurotrypsin-like [Mizuhopecten yessoensis]|uniref:Neurotrypsin n=1 Tax=Mizuhopecten yessoensis TaxID=6573 RepID=A0A210PLU5_MIZYE|nr:neurotrypsin-like [Mizuhopecten yessoensis]OWF37434.1 Neurotrypsin [Mizuhopecten yessoensis]